MDRPYAPLIAFSHIGTIFQLIFYSSVLNVLTKELHVTTPCLEHRFMPPTPCGVSFVKFYPIASVSIAVIGQFCKPSINNKIKRKIIGRMIQLIVFPPINISSVNQ